jgi:hypothetical protein
MGKTLAIALVSTLLTSTSPALAHHSPFTYFDPSQSILVEGEISLVKWRNPHAEFRLVVKDDSGNDVTWILETHSVSILRRMDLSRDVIKVGDKVRAIGWPAKRGGEEIFVTNMLLPDGREIVFDPGSKPQWSKDVEGDPSGWMVTEDSLEDGDSDAEGIFHVWSTSLVGGDGNFLYENYDFPLTDKAAAARAGFDMYAHPIIGTCKFKGMPTIMEQPYPMQFAQSHNLILMHMEEGDTVRVFDMTPGAEVSDGAPTALGHSVGQWEGSTLLVTTTGSDWPYVDVTGVPNSADAIYVERFAPSANGKRLDYTLTITDPQTFTTPPTFSKSWLWVPGERVAPYNCESDD